MKLSGILRLERASGLFAAEKNLKVAALGNSIASKFSRISNGSTCIGQTISRDIKQFNTLTQQSQQKQVRFADPSATKATVSGPSENKLRSLISSFSSVQNMAKDATNKFQRDACAQQEKILFNAIKAELKQNIS
ncbi:hypothetical protein ACNSO8_19785 [Yersinia sp. LJYL362]|uniref:hypothetical protein n=1 Tax=Yersinia sp. LJYL362 TaxID=3402108 RepID=UPI003AB80236